MKLDIGTIRSDCRGFSSLAKLLEITKDISMDQVDLDFRRCSWFDANMTAPLYVLISRLRNALNIITLQNLPEKIETILKRNEFLSTFNMEKLSDHFQTTLPFKTFKPHATEQFNDYLSAYLHGKGIPSMSKALSKRFQQSLLEIFLNAKLHSDSDSSVFVCGQLYPQKHKLDFTIADAGIGIWDNVRRYTKQEDLDSCDAIKWALADGNTTKTTHQPGGLGFKLIQEFVQKNQGKLQIVSRFGYYELSGSEPLFAKMDNDFSGTCVNIEINTDDRKTYCLQSELTSRDIF